MKPAASLCLTASSNRVTVSFTEYLLGLVIRPSSAACAAPPHIVRESTKLVRFFLKVIKFPNLLLVSLGRPRDVRLYPNSGAIADIPAGPGCATSGSTPVEQ